MSASVRMICPPIGIWSATRRREKERARKQRYRKKYREKECARVRRYRKEHPEKERARKQRYRERYPEKDRAHVRRYRERYPEKVRARKQRYGIRRAADAFDPDLREERIRLYELTSMLRKASKVSKETKK